MWPKPDETQELIEQAKEGNVSAAGNLLDRHRDALRRMVDLRLDRAIRRRVDASDIVQEAMVEANRRLNRYLEDPSMPFRLWIRQIAMDRIIDAHRRHRGSAKRSVDKERPMQAGPTLDRSTLELAGQLCDPELTPAARATMEELQRRFEDAIEQLNDQDKEVVLMRHFENLTNQETADALGLTQPAAGMRYMRAMRKLRQLLEEPSDRSQSGDA